MRHTAGWRLAVALCGTMMAQLLGMLPVSAASPDPGVLPDPPAHRPIMPAELQRIQPRGSVKSIENHIRKQTPDELAELERHGIHVLRNEDGLLIFDLAKDGRVHRGALYDTKTASGISVIGLGIADENSTTTASSSATGGLFAFGPQSALANVRAQDHKHVLGPPFHDNCSYLFMYGGGSDAYIHVCSLDVTNIRIVGDLAAAAIGIATGLPLLGWVAGLVWNVGLSYFQNPDGSIDIYLPGTSSANHYGSIFYYGSRSGWYYYYARTSAYYGYALRQATGVRYYIRLTVW